jgi:hypothetical protein
MYMKCAEILTELDDACYTGKKALDNILVPRKRRHWVSNGGTDMFTIDQTRAVEARDTLGSVSWDHPSRRDYSECPAVLLRVCYKARTVLRVVN